MIYINFCSVQCSFGVYFELISNFYKRLMIIICWEDSNIPVVISCLFILYCPWMIYTSALKIRIKILNY